MDKYLVGYKRTTEKLWFLKLVLKRNYRKILLKVLRLHHKDKKSVTIVSMWQGMGDICNYMAFFPYLCDIYGKKHIYFVISRDKQWLFNKYNIGEKNLVFVSKKTIPNITFLPYCDIFQSNKYLRFFFGRIVSMDYGSFTIDKSLERFIDIISVLLFNEIKKPIPIINHTNKSFERKRIAIVNYNSHSFSINNYFSNLLENYLLSLNFEVIYNLNRPFGCVGKIFNGSVDEFAEMCLKSYLLISIRTGLLDYVLTTGVKIIAIYPDESKLKSWSLDRYIEYYGNIHEIDYKQFEEDYRSIIKKVIL